MCWRAIMKSTHIYRSFTYKVLFLVCVSPVLYIYLLTCMLTFCACLIFIKFQINLLVAQCTPLWSFFNLQYKVDSFLIGVVADIYCPAGMRMLDGYVYKTITCLRSGNWDKVVSDCSSKLIPQKITEFDCCEKS